MNQLKLLKKIPITKLISKQSIKPIVLFSTNHTVTPPFVVRRAQDKEVFIIILSS